MDSEYKKIVLGSEEYVLLTRKSGGREIYPKIYSKDLDGFDLRDGELYQLISKELFGTECSQIFFKVGQGLHRIDGPAYIRQQSKEWLLNGVLHREDGPARIFHDTKTISWWYLGLEYNFEDYCNISGKSREEQFVLRLKWADYQIHLVF